MINAVTAQAKRSISFVVLSAAVAVVIIMVKTKDMVFKPFKVTQQTVVTGGLLKKPHPVTTMSIPCGYGAVQHVEFVLLEKQAEWLRSGSVRTTGLPEKICASVCTCKCLCVCKCASV